VYKTTCEATNKYYFGLHSTDNLDDGYLGSGQVLSRSVKKYGRDKHVFEILEHFTSRNEAAKKEKELITAEHLKNPMCMNLRGGGTGCYPGRPTKDETKQRLSATGKTRWIHDRQKLREQLEEDLKNFTLSRNQILDILLTKEGQLNKNITQHPANPEKTKGGDGLLNRTAAMNTAKWKFIWRAIQNPEFGDDSVELINAFVFTLKKRPTCKTCGGKVSFFRFNQPYATYCGSSCQLRDPDFKNPIHSRWNK
jgi:hypothetical protein